MLSPEKNSGDYRRDCSLSTPTLPNPHYPSKSTISLPPLSKVRCCRPKKFGRLPEGLLYTHQPLHPPQPLRKDNNPLPHTMFLPPLSKGGGLTARHKLLSCCVLIATHLPFYSLNFYAVKTEGLSHHPHHQWDFPPPTFITNYTKSSYIYILLSFAQLNVIAILFSIFLLFPLSPLCDFPFFPLISWHFQFNY